MKRTVCVAVIAVVMIVLLSCGTIPQVGQDKQKFKYEYGVFLSYEGDLSDLSDYGTVVIDAQYVSKDDIRKFKKKGHTVYSYINVGSLEDFRDYYEEYKDLALSPYEHWDEEVWVNVADKKWQDFVVDELAASLKEKGIDGFFADNCDVYYYYPAIDILNGTAHIMEGLRDGDMPVLINGGDYFLDAYCENGGDPLDVASGINQETVFSEILWDEGEFGTADEESFEYFSDYVERYAEKGLDIYLLEYTTDSDLCEKIKSYCEEHGFRYYISDSVELLSPDYILA